MTRDHIAYPGSVAAVTSLADGGWRVTVALDQRPAITPRSAVALAGDPPVAGTVARVASRRAGRWTVAVDLADHAAPPEPETDTVIALLAAPGPDLPAGPASPPARSSSYARDLRLSGWLRSPDVWRALGSDADYLAWLRERECCAPSMAARAVTDIGPCGGDVVPAHVRRISAGAGTGRKPEYCAIPLCDAHHRLQHQRGESAIAPREDWDRERIRWSTEWAWSRLRAELGLGSMRDASPDVVRAWAEARGVERGLPDA